jgi:hypothetical protein
VYCTARLYIALYCAVIHCTALHCTVPYCITSERLLAYRITSNCFMKQFSTPLCSAPHVVHCVHFCSNRAPCDFLAPSACDLIFSCHYLHSSYLFVTALSFPLPSPPPSIPLTLHHSHSYYPSPSSFLLFLLFFLAGLGEKPDHLTVKATINYIKHDTDPW